MLSTWQGYVLRGFMFGFLPNMQPEYSLVSNIPLILITLLGAKMILPINFLRILMAFTDHELQNTTKTIVSALKNKSDLRPAMRGGLYLLSGLVVRDFFEIQALDNDEQGLHLLSTVESLTPGWGYIASHMDRNGRTFVDESGAADMAKMHYLFAQAHAAEIILTGEQYEKDLSNLAFCLGELTLKSTRPVI